MAQDIIIAGAQYPEVPAINIPKTAGGTALFVDTSEDTITAEKLLNGITAHDKNGEKVTGTLPEVVQATPIIDVDVMGKVTAHASQKAGVVAAGTKSATMQLPTQDPDVIIPSSSMQIAVEKGVFTTGFVRVAAVFAVIGVTYPAGSTCTCTNGETTLTAEDTSGKAMFIIPEAGTWTVTATSGNKSVSKAVSITVAGQVETVTLIFDLILFDGGDNTGVTGGWKGKNVTPTVSNVLSFSATNTNATFPNAASVYTENKFDLSKYNKLTVVKSEADGWYIGVTENVFSWSTYPPGADTIGFIAYANLNTSDDRIEIDISGINTECYVATYVRIGSINPEVGPKTYSATLTSIMLS